MTVAAAGAVGVYAAVAVRYRLGAGDWVSAAITLVFLASFTLATATLLRRPRVALPGLPGGLFVTSSGRPALAFVQVPVTFAIRRRSRSEH